MDWSKAKNIFIISFLLLNFLLGYQLYLKRSEYLHNLQWATNSIQEVSDRLVQEKIKLNIDIPKEIPRMQFLHVNNKIYFKDQKLNSIINTPINREALESLISKEIANFNQYKFSPIESTKDHLVYFQIANNYPFFGARIEININEKQEITYSQNYFEILNRGLDREIVSAYSALITILDQQLIPGSAEIVQIKLGYYGQTNQTNITPVWKIVYKINDKREEIYVNAMTGGLENIFNY